jgi:hypothetical protein
MSWFLLKHQPKRNLRKDICLRIGNLPKPLLDKIVSELPNEGLYSGEMKFAQIDYIKIAQLLPKGKVRLEIWSSTHEDRVKNNATFNSPIPTLKYTVLQIIVPEDGEWVCEGDVGRGLVKSKAKSRS